jgi:8-oxo-dGTP pyrophosphatase MutT (NUDIX family)
LKEKMELLPSSFLFLFVPSRPWPLATKSETRMQRTPHVHAGRAYRPEIKQQPMLRTVLCVGARGEELARAVADSVAKSGWSMHRSEDTSACCGTKPRAGPTPALGIVDCNVKVGLENGCLALLTQLRQACSGTFVMGVGQRLATDPAFRMLCFDAGAMMVAPDVAEVSELIRRLDLQRAESGRGDGRRLSGGLGARAACPRCGLDGLTEDGLRLHHSLYHSAAPNEAAVCPLCASACPVHGASNFACHLHNAHGPLSEREPPAPDFAAFAWVVCRRADGAFLIVNEPAGICRSGRPGFWLPAGRVDAGETFVEAAIREAKEEAGVEIVVEGLLRCDLRGGAQRIVLFARPRDVGTPPRPKSIPDFESVGAMWADPSRLAALRRRDYRCPDPAELFPAVASGARKPLSLDTEAWRGVEAATRAATATSRGEAGWKAAIDRVAAAWGAMQRAYPRAIFRY